MILNQNIFGQNYVDSLINELKKTEFYPTVFEAKEKLLNKGKEAIPKLIELLEDTSFVKLTKTMDLIYPGATEFYGSGYIIDYDIDWISVRAAWVLEDLTFEDFGYKQNQISEDVLFKLMKSNYESEYLKEGKYNIDFKDTIENGNLTEYRKELAQKVRAWWESSQSEWTRFNAIKNALLSKNINRQLNVLNYLRFEESYCEGLSKDRFEKELKPLIKEIIRKGNDVSIEQAKLLLDDKEFYWYKIKIKK